MRCILIFLLLASFFGWSQTHTISGYIRDAASEENLIGATVVDLFSQKGTVANTYGFYSLTLPGDSVVLGVSYVGYTPQIVKLRLVKDTVLIVRLKATLLDEVTINADRVEEIHQTTRMGTVNIPIQQIRRVPAFMGEADVIKVLQLLPGVQGGNEGSGGLYVRGGGPDQNLVLLDGVPIYNPTHLYGFFSTFNPDAINHVELVKGGFPARYGGRLSSVVDITMKEGDQHRIHGQGSIGLISAKLALEGPIIKDRTSFVVSGRRSYLNLLNSTIIPKVPGNPSDDYRFYDFNVKVNHRVNASNRIYLSGYTGEDFANNHFLHSFTDSLNENHYVDRSHSIMKWGNTIGSLRWNHVFGKRLFSNLSLNYSRYSLETDVNNSYEHTTLATGDVDTVFYSHQYRSGIRDYSAKVDFDFIPNPRHYIRFGGQAISHEFSPGALAEQSSEKPATLKTSTEKIPANEYAVFVEDDIEVTKVLRTNLGVHASAFSVGGENFYSVQPRLSMRYMLRGLTALKASYSVMQQYVHLLTNAGLGLPTDLWVPATGLVPPQRSWQVAIGGAKTIFNDYEISVEGFYKDMDNVVEYKDGASYMDADVDWQSKVEIGEGRSYGTEFFFQKKVGQWSGWVGYTLSWTERRFDNLSDGNWFPYRYDRRHDFKITSTYTLKHWDFGATWVFNTGNAVTVPLEAYSAEFDYPVLFTYGGTIRHYTGRNNFRMRNYHRLDLNVSYRFKWRQTEHQFAFSVYNAYARNNPFYLQFVGTARGNALKQESLFPILPSISYSVKF